MTQKQLENKLKSSNIEAKDAIIISQQVYEQAKGLDKKSAQGMVDWWHNIVDNIVPEVTSHKIRKEIFNEVYKNWDAEKSGLPPVIFPSEELKRNANVTAEIKRLGLKNENEYYHYTVSNGRELWGDAVIRAHIGQAIKNGMEINEQTIVDASDPKDCKWLKGAKLNIADAMMWQAKENPEKTALIYQREDKNEVVKYTYRQLDEMSNQFANGLKEKGIKEGDHIALCTGGMNAESISAYIGMLKAGVIPVAVLPDFESHDIKLRTEQIPEGVKGFVTQNYTYKNDKKYPLYEKIASLDLNVPSFVIKDDTDPTQLKKGDSSFNDLINEKSKEFTSVARDADSTCIVLFSSGTKGVPKGFGWGFDPYVKSTNDAYVHLDLKPQDRLNWPSNFGWMMGSFDIAAGFMNGATLTVYEGKIAAEKYKEFLQDTKVTVMGSIPAYGKLFEENNIFKPGDLPDVRIFASTASASSPDNYFYMASVFNFKVPMIEYSGGTELGGAGNTSFPTQNMSVSEFKTPAVGTKIYLVQDKENPHSGEMKIIVANKDGYIPPMGLSRKGINFNHEEKYYPEPEKDGVYLRSHGDLLKLPNNMAKGEITDINNLSMLSNGRSDEDFKTAGGQKTSSVEMENLIMAGLSKVNEEPELRKAIKNIAVIGGLEIEGKKDQIAAYVVMDKNLDGAEDKLAKLFVKAIRNQLHLLAQMDRVIITDEIPGAATGKIKHDQLKKDFLKLQENNDQRTVS